MTAAGNPWWTATAFDRGSSDSARVKDSTRSWTLKMDS